MKPFNDAIKQADYLSRRTSRIILNEVEGSTVLTRDLRKVLLDSVNDFKRDIIRYIYEIDE